MIVGIRPITDHGGLTGLSDDDHTLYFKADGSRNLTGALITSGQGIRPAANSTTAIQIQQADGTAFVNFNTTNKRVGIGTTSPSYPLHVSSTGSLQVNFTATGTKYSLFECSNGTGSLYISKNGDGAADIVANDGLTYAGIFHATGNRAMQLCTNDWARITILGSGYIGFATKAPTYDLSFGGNSARTIWLERHTTDSTAGNNLTVQAGGCKASQTNIGGGAYILSDGIGTGNAYGGGVLIKNYIAGVSGTADNSQVTVFEARNNEIAFFGGTRAAQQVLAAYTSDAESSPYIGIDNAQAGSVYAQVSDLNLLRAAYETLRASYDDLRTKLVTSTFMTSA